MEEKEWKRIRKITSQPSLVWGGGLLRNRLERFSKNKKRNAIISCSIIGIILLIGVIYLYRTYALYEEKKEFNVLKGRVPDFLNDVTLALTLDDKPIEKIPEKNSNPYAIRVTCNQGEGVWNVENWGIEVKHIEGKEVKCKIAFSTLKANESIFQFDYIGKEEAISLPSGKYKLEVWGAQGGVGGSHIEEKSQRGGLGGYSKGEITINNDEIIYINVGGQGSNQQEENKEIFGGYNGGGKGLGGAYSGGGATHIAKISGLLATLEQKKESILIVAGGGGGNARNDDTPQDDSEYAYGGSGGGFKGKDGINSYHENLYGYIGTGATQTEGGENIASKVKGLFGLGDNYSSTFDSGAGGGGGFYGGGGSSRHHAGGGGGSGYIGNPSLINKEMYCFNCEANNKVNTKTISTTNVSNEAISQYAKQGNGYAKITYLGK